MARWLLVNTSTCIYVKKNGRTMYLGRDWLLLEVKIEVTPIFVRKNYDIII